MTTKTQLQNDKHISVVFGVKRANPNGDPLADNYPRQDLRGYGIVSDVALKRKIRNQLQMLGEPVLYGVSKFDAESKDYSIVSKLKTVPNLFESVNDVKETKAEKAKKKAVVEEGLPKLSKYEKERFVADSFTDVRFFGAVIATNSDGGTTSVGVTAPVSIQEAISLDPIEIESVQITKSINGVDKENGGKASDTMGMYHVVPYAIYKFNIHVSKFLANKYGFTEEDFEKLVAILPRLFDNDASSARPAGSMEVLSVVVTNDASKHSKRELDNALEVTYSQEVHDFDTVTFKTTI